MIRKVWAEVAHNLPSIVTAALVLASLLVIQFGVLPAMRSLDSELENVKANLLEVRELTAGNRDIVKANQEVLLRMLRQGESGGERK